MKPALLATSLQQSLKSHIKAVSGLQKATGELIEAITILNNRKGKIIVTGVGKSAFIGMKMAATLTSLGEHAQFLHPTDALHGDSGLAKSGDVIVAFSYSGESKEVVRIVDYLSKTHALQVVSITGNKKSSLGKISDVVIELLIKEEGSPHNLAPMASTTTSLVAADLIAHGLALLNHFSPAHFATAHPGGRLGLRLTTVEEVMLQGDAMPLIKEHKTLREGMSIINEKGRGVVGIVSSHGVLVGIITDGDLRRFFSRYEESRGVKVGDIMTKKPKVIDKNENIAEALDILETWKITSLFVVDKKGKPIGLLHIHDILDRAW